MKSQLADFLCSGGKLVAILRGQSILGLGFLKNCHISGSFVPYKVAMKNSFGSEVSRNIGNKTRSMCRSISNFLVSSSEATACLS
jgi:hypothetical protein